MGTYHIWTLGCQVNLADSDKLAAGLRRLGWDATDRPEDADFVVLNTCAVRQHAEDKAASKLGLLKRIKQSNPALKVAVMGCTVGARTTELERRFPFVDVFAQPQRFDKVIAVLDLPEADLGGEFWPSVMPNGEVRGEAKPFAYVPVIEGCDKFCTYCIVPLRRGRERSRPIAEIRREVEAHVARGVREVTLLGQTVEAYGKDQPAVSHGTAHADLFDLMTAIHDLPGLLRIRHLTSYPPDMTDRILEGMATLPKVCQSFSLPVQSGDDQILETMRRGYTVATFVERVERVRQLMPESGISTDVIVGFPGETEAQFRSTYRLLESLRFDKVHVAAYSSRPGTYAARHQPDDVPRETKLERLHAVEALQRGIAAEINHALFGSTLPVLVETGKLVATADTAGARPHDGQTRAGARPHDGQTMERLTGRTRTNKLVHFDAPQGGYAPGALVDVTITRTGPWALQGRLPARDRATAKPPGAALMAAPG